MPPMSHDEEDHVSAGGPAPDAAPASGPAYTKFIADFRRAGHSLKHVVNSDYNGEGVFMEDLRAAQQITDVPLTLTVVDGQYVVHPVVEMRDLT